LEYLLLDDFPGTREHQIFPTHPFHPYARAFNRFICFGANLDSIYFWKSIVTLYSNHMYADFYYTVPQQIALVVLSLISGLISFAGSIILASIIWRDRQSKLKFVYHRILFAVSILDCVTSLVFAFGFLAVPSGFFWGAIGNTTTCEVSGFLTIFLGAQFLYNFGLAFYFLMIIYFKKSQKFIAKHFEPFIHIFSLCFPLGIALIALKSTSLNPLLYVGGWCYLYPYPPTCIAPDNVNVKCIRGMNSQVVRQCMIAIAVVAPFVGIVICMIMIVHRIRSIAAASLPFSMRSQMDQKVRQTTIQALLYIGAMLVPCILIIVTQTMWSYDPTLRFIFGLLVKLIVPLQGFFNLIIYIRPRILALRQRHGGTGSFLKHFWCVIKGEGGQYDGDTDYDLASGFSRLHVETQEELDTSRNQTNAEIVKIHVETQG
jgi:hypothetical protein